MTKFDAVLIGARPRGHIAAIRAAAGHPHGVFKLKPQDLERLTGAPVADVAQDPRA
jgi:hypothetical protein